MLATAAIAIAAMTAAPDGPDARAPGLRCAETWRATANGIDVRVVECVTADVHAADRDASATIFVRGANGWFAADAPWTANDVEMSTASSTRVVHRRARVGALADHRPIVVVQLDLVETVVDRDGDHRSERSRRALVLACVLDRVAPACTAPVAMRCGARCDHASVRGDELRWRDLDGDHREPLEF